jgi:hypothetical protein
MPVPFSSNGSFSYTPDANYNGPDYFTFRTNDGTANRPGPRVKITVKLEGVSAQTGRQVTIKDVRT